MKKNTALTFRHAKETIEKIKELSAKEGLSQSDLIAKAVYSYEESQHWANPFYRCNELYMFVTEQMTELQHLEDDAEMNGVEMQEYVAFLNTTVDNIRNLKAFWEPRNL